MSCAGSRRVELLVPVRTLIVVAAAVGVIAAFRAIGDTFLIVFVGIFLALVFEYPVRYVMARTPLSRGLAATATVLGTALVVAFSFLLLLVPLVGGIVAVTLFGALLGVLGALTAVPLAATLQIFVQELSQARREWDAAAKAQLASPGEGA